MCRFVCALGYKRRLVGKEMTEFKMEEHKVLQQLNTVTIARKEVELVRLGVVWQ